jgi:hypothetical protein
LLGLESVQNAPVDHRRRPAIAIVSADAQRPSSMFVQSVFQMSRHGRACVPTIHVFLAGKDVDARHKAGHDGAIQGDWNLH